TTSSTTTSAAARSGSWRRGASGSRAVHTWCSGEGPSPRSARPRGADRKCSECRRLLFALLLLVEPDLFAGAPHQVPGDPSEHRTEQHDPDQLGMSGHEHV